MGGSPSQPAPGLHSCHMGVYGPIHLPSPLTEAQDVRVLSWPATSHPERTTGGCASEALERRDATAPVLPLYAPRHSLAIRFHPADSAQPKTCPSYGSPSQCAAAGPRHPPVYAFGITLDAQPPALRSTRNRLRTAVRRGAARPGGATKQLHGSARAISRWKVASPPSLHGLRGTAGAVHRNTVWASQRGRSAWWPRRSGCRPCLRHPVGVLGQRPASSVRCERPVSTRACRGDRCPVSGAGV